MDISSFVVSSIYLEFNNECETWVDIYDTPLGEAFYQQHKQLKLNNACYGQPILADHARYTISYFNRLVQQAQEVPGIDWYKYNILPGEHNYHHNQQQFNDMHRDLEVLAGINNYQGLTNSQKSLMNELHCCLHTLETPAAKYMYEFRGRDFMQFKHDIAMTMSRIPQGTRFDRVIHQGQVILDYPYVGKEPMACLMHQDNTILQQSCRVVDHISAGWKTNVSTAEQKNWLPVQFPEDIDSSLTSWYYDNIVDMNALGYDLDLVLARSGWPIVGQIRDMRKIKYLRYTEYLEITGYELVD